MQVGFRLRCSCPSDAPAGTRMPGLGAPHHTESRLTMAAFTNPENSTTLTDVTWQDPEATLNSAKAHGDWLDFHEIRARL
jgi:hypothetical protein